MGKGTLEGVKTTSTGVPAGARGSAVTFTAGWLKSHDRVTGEPLASPTVFRILFQDHNSLVANGDKCMTTGFVMKKTDGTKANNVAAPSNGDVDERTGEDGAFVVSLKVPQVFPGTSTPIPTGKSKICGMEQSPVLNDTGTVHLTFKVTVT